MARFHGDTARVYLGTRDFSGDAMSIDPKFDRAMHERTTFADAGWKKYDGGLAEGSGAIEAFYDNTVGAAFDQIFSTIFLTAAAGLAPMSVYFGSASAIGNDGLLFPDCRLKQVGEPIKVNELVKLNVDFQSQGRVGLIAKLLHVQGAESATGNSAQVDNGAATTNGGRGTIHVTGVTGANPHTIKIQHSADGGGGGTWVDLITFTAVAGATAQTAEVTGTVRQYLREVHTVGATSTVTYNVGFSRY